MSNSQNGGAPAPDRAEDYYYFDGEYPSTWYQPPFAENNSSAPAPGGDWGSSSGWAGHQAADQHQTLTQSFDGGYHPITGDYNQLPALDPVHGYARPQPPMPSNAPFAGHVYPDPFAGHAYPDLGVQQGPYIPYNQQTYPAHQPVYTRPQAPPLDGVSMPAAPVQQGAPADEEAAFEPVFNKRKREDRQENESDQPDQAPKKKSRSEKGVETKKQKADDKEYRVYLRRRRDETVSRLSDLGHRLILDGAGKAEFDQLIKLLADLNRQIDVITEENIEFYSVRPEKRPANRPAKIRYDD